MMFPPPKPRSSVAAFLSLIFSAAVIVTAQTTPQVQNSTLQQTITSPISGDILTPGAAFTVTWHFSSYFQNISLELWDNTFWGYSRDFGIDRCHFAFSSFCGTIASNIPNTGSFLWNIPIPNNDMYPRNQSVFWIKMYVDDYFHPEVGNTVPVVSYSSNFSFDGGVGNGSPEGSGVRPSPINQSFGATLTPTESSLAPTGSQTQGPPESMGTMTVGAATGVSMTSDTAGAPTALAATATASSTGVVNKIRKAFVLSQAASVLLLFGL